MYDYAYKAFHKLRYLDGITSYTIYNSLDPETNHENAMKAGESTDKSGSFFFFTQDRKFIIKTIFQEEKDLFMQDLNEYFLHIENNPNLLIAKMYGLF